MCVSFYPLSQGEPKDTAWRAAMQERSRIIDVLRQFATELRADDTSIGNAVATVVDEAIRRISKLADGQ